MSSKDRFKRVGSYSIGLSPIVNPQTKKNNFLNIIIKPANLVKIFFDWNNKSKNHHLKIQIQTSKHL